MTYPVTVYVDATGNVYGACDTDQKYTQKVFRTVNGKYVEYAGTWYASQMSYKPFQKAVIKGANRAKGNE